MHFSISRRQQNNKAGKEIKRQALFWLVSKTKARKQVFIWPISGGKESLQADQGPIWNNRGKSNFILREWYIVYKEKRINQDFKTQVDEWIKDVDYDGDGQLSFEEFKFSLAGNLNKI